MKINNIKVENMLSDSTGRAVPNQFIIYTNEGIYFQSYSTMIAFIDRKGKVFLVDGALDYSNTTNRWLYRFLRDYANMYDLNKAEVVKLIKDGTIQIAE